MSLCCHQKLLSGVAWMLFQHYMTSYVFENFLVSKMCQPWISPQKYLASKSSVRVNLYIWLYQSRPHPTWTLTPPLYSPVVSLTWPWLHRPSAYTQEATAPLAGCSLPLTEFSSWVIVFKGGKCQREAFRTVWTDQTVFNTLSWHFRQGNWTLLSSAVK